MPVIISVLLLLSGLIGTFIGQRMIKNRYDFFFRQIQPEDVVVGRTVFLCREDGTYQKKTISNILTFGNEWKAFETDDGCRHVLGECLIKEESLRSRINKETEGKWMSREELDQYQKAFATPVKQVKDNSAKE